ncbi:Fc.00g085160.m01.CDS01 [Cosmosporella sp. VM-42]
MTDAKVADPDLPSYQDSNESAAVNEVLGPATLYIAGRFIYSSDPNAPPLYELSHSIGFLADYDRTVRFERLDHSVKDNNGTPEVSSRKRQIFDLKHPTPAEFPNFEFHAESVSRRSALCSFGISTFPLHRVRPGKGFQIQRAVRGPDNRYAPKDKEVLFTAAPSRDKAVGYEWSDAQGNLMAREVETDDLMTFVIGAEMGAPTRDVLVASWVVRVWWELARGNYREKRWDEAKRILHTSRANLGGMSSSSGLML